MGLHEEAAGDVAHHSLPLNENMINWEFLPSNPPCCLKNVPVTARQHPRPSPPAATLGWASNTDLIPLTHKMTLFKVQSYQVSEGRHSVYTSIPEPPHPSPRLWDTFATMFHTNQGPRWRLPEVLS